MSVIRTERGDVAIARAAIPCPPSEVVDELWRRILMRIERQGPDGDAAGSGRAT